VASSSASISAPTLGGSDGTAGNALFTSLLQPLASALVATVLVSVTGGDSGGFAGKDEIGGPLQGALRAYVQAALAPIAPSLVQSGAGFTGLYRFATQDTRPLTEVVTTLLAPVRDRLAGLPAAEHLTGPLARAVDDVLSALNRVSSEGSDELGAWFQRFVGTTPPPSAVTTPATSIPAPPASEEEEDTDGPAAVLAPLEEVPEVRVPTGDGKISAVAAAAVFAAGLVYGTREDRDDPSRRRSRPSGPR
jgi:hypothetical protein